MVRPAIIVMVKAPRAGAVKTRLVPPLSHTHAAALARCFACDVIANMSCITSDVIIAYAPQDGRAIIENILIEHLSGENSSHQNLSLGNKSLGDISSANLIYVEQHGEDLGARLAHIAAEADGRDFSPLIFVGTDSPTLPRQFIENALRLLIETPVDVTLGATRDGGYYSIGYSIRVRRQSPALFDGISWSSAQVYRQTISNIKRLKLRFHEMPVWYDVDEAPDLARLQLEFDQSPDARRRAPATYRWLAEHLRFSQREPERNDERESAG